MFHAPMPARNGRHSKCHPHAKMPSEPVHAQFTHRRRSEEREVSRETRTIAKEEKEEDAVCEEQIVEEPVSRTDLPSLRSGRRNIASTNFREATLRNCTPCHRMCFASRGHLHKSRFILSASQPS